MCRKIKPAVRSGGQVKIYKKQNTISNFHCTTKLPLVKINVLPSQVPMFDQVLVNLEEAEELATYYTRQAQLYRSLKLMLEILIFGQAGNDR